MRWEYGPKKLEVEKKRSEKVLVLNSESEF